MFDEPTSSLDPINEERIINEVVENSVNTTIMVLHRMRISRKFDKILLILNGKLEGYDTFDKLIESNQLFKDMVESQEV